MASMKTPSPLLPRALPRLALAASLVAAPCTAVFATTPSELAGRYASQGATAPDAARGQRFFTERHGREWACASCHGSTPTGDGRHAATGRSIGALAPAFNPERFTDPAKVEKWFRRNCNDVVGRECSASEKADVIAWLSSLKP